MLRLLFRFVPASFSLLGIANAQQAPASGAIPTFFAPALVEAHHPYHLTLSSNRPDVTRWQIDWGDGAQRTEAASSTGSDHLYDKPGRYLVKVQAALADGTQLPALRDVGRLLQEDKPAATSDSPPAGTAPSPQTQDFLSALTAHAATAHEPAKLERFSISPSTNSPSSSGCAPNDLSARQELLAATGGKGTTLELYLEKNALHLALPGGDSFIQPLSAIQPGTWHHVAVTYDRAPTFPYSNVARFYLDGVLAGEYHLDRYDTGAVELPAASIGSAADGSLALNGSIAELARLQSLDQPDAPHGPRPPSHRAGYAGARRRAEERGDLHRGRAAHLHHRRRCAEPRPHDRQRSRCCAPPSTQRSRARGCAW